jgi:glycosyltransferase involved in cell wall biosynthesis
MRFLFFTQYFPPEIGASQVRLAAVIRELVRRGHEVEVITALPNYPTGRIFPEYRGHLYVCEEWEGVLVHRVWLYPAIGAGFKRMLNYASFAINSVYGLLRARKPDYIFVESPPIFLSPAAWFASQRWGVPFIFNVADLWPDSIQALGSVRNQWLLGFAKYLEAWSYRQARFINAVTEGVRLKLIEKGVPPNKVLFLPNGVDTDTFKPMPPDLELLRELGLAELKNKTIILYAGTLGFAHGLDVVLKALPYLKERMHMVHVLFVGDGSERAKLEALQRRLGLINVTFLPPQPPEVVARLYSFSYAGITTQRNLPLLEGNRPAKIPVIMASGRPVIFSGSGEASRLIESAQAGLVVPPEDPVALSDAIRYLLDRPEEAKRLGANGRRYVEDNLSWTTLVGRWLGELEEREGLKP